MKDSNNSHINHAGVSTNHKFAKIDILRLSEVVALNRQKLTVQPRRKRRTNYIKKIQNDSFLMKV